MNTAFNPTNYEAVLEQCDSVPQEVILIAVTKYTTVEAMRQAYENGVRHFGENKVQDLQDKQAQFPSEKYPDLHWHMIGHLQSNKVSKVVGNVSYIHSVDSKKLLRKINDAAERLGIVQNVLLQVNLTDEESKSGFRENHLLVLFEDSVDLKNVNVGGLMTMGPTPPENFETVEKQDADNLHDHAKQTQAIFAHLNELLKSLNSQTGKALIQLSMGMSNDYSIALQEGATMIRVGSYLFLK